MFVRTERLTLRPGWMEDAPELARAIAHESVVRNLGRAPWPYALSDAQAFLALERGAATPSFLIQEHVEGRVRIVGGIGVGAFHGEPYELGYWLTPDAWGRGYATEAGLGVIRAARALRIPRLSAGHFIDNPGSGRVLRKLGFRHTGRTEAMFSQGRGVEVPCVRMELVLAKGCDADPDCRMAA